MRSRKRRQPRRKEVGLMRLHCLQSIAVTAGWNSGQMHRSETVTIYRKTRTRTPFPPFGYQQGCGLELFDTRVVPRPYRSVCQLDIGVYTPRFTLLCPLTHDYHTERSHLPQSDSAHVFTERTTSSAFDQPLHAPTYINTVPSHSHARSHSISAGKPLVGRRSLSAETSR
jgi:hypothetical protein